MSAWRLKLARTAGLGRFIAEVMADNTTMEWSRSHHPRARAIRRCVCCERRCAL
jgi:hypothetical protein